jgi:hypothetical protein
MSNVAETLLPRPAQQITERPGFRAAQKRNRLRAQIKKEPTGTNNEHD